MADDEDSKIQLALLQRDLGFLRQLFDKFDTAIEKLQSVASDITKIVSLQEQKINLQEKINNEVDEILDRQEREFKEQIRDLQNKVEISQSAILKELASVKDQLNTKISALESWRYMVMGIISVGTFIISN